MSGYGSAAALLHDIHLCFYICIAKRHFTEYLFFLSSDCYSVCIMYKKIKIYFKYFQRYFVFTHEPLFVHPYIRLSSRCIRGPQSVLEWSRKGRPFGVPSSHACVSVRGIISARLDVSSSVPALRHRLRVGGCGHSFPVLVGKHGVSLLLSGYVFQFLLHAVLLSH